MDGDQTTTPRFEDLEDGLKELVGSPYERPVVDDPWRQLRLMHDLAATLLEQYGVAEDPEGAPAPLRSSTVEARVVETVTRPIPAFDIEDESSGAEEGDAEKARETLRRNYELVLSELGEGPASAFTLSGGIRELGRRAREADHEREMRDELARLDLVLEVESLREELLSAWHAGAFGDRDLQDVLGMDDESYSVWVSHGPRALEQTRSRPSAGIAIEEATARLEELECLDPHRSTIHYVLGEVHEIAKTLRRAVGVRP